MPKYRVPFRGAVLVEADSDGALLVGMWASMWTVSMVHTTVRAKEPQPVGDEIKGAYFAIDDAGIEEVTAALEEAKRRYHQVCHPLMVPVARACDPNIPDEQFYFDFYERDCRRS
jgi:hypothetical protein